MSIELQNKIRQNAIEMREVVSDLYEWEQEMELKEKMRNKFKKEEKEKSNKNQEPIRNVKPAQSQENQKKKEEKKEEAPNKEEKKDLVRDSNTIKDYYKAWDKYDVDKQLDKLEEEAQKPYKPYNPYEDSKNNLRAKPKTKINVKGRRNIVSDPTDLKDKGNLHFQSLEFDKAVTCYSECLKKLEEENTPIEKMTEDRKKLRCIVLSNRAMTYLKLHETVKALNDASESLKFNPKYSKSYYRRAECLKKLGKYRESLRDFRMVKTLQPNQSKADAQIKKIQVFLQKRAREARESLLLEYNPNIMTGSRRLQIEEVDELTPETKSEPQPNYLQQL